MSDQMLASNSADGNYPLPMQEPVRDYMTGNGNPQPAPTNVIRRVEIAQLNHGYVVTVGCQAFAIENPSTLIAKLAEYINNPAATEQKWNEGKLF